MTPSTAHTSTGPPVISPDEEADLELVHADEAALLLGLATSRYTGCVGHPCPIKAMRCDRVSIQYRGDMKDAVHLRSLVSDPAVPRLHDRLRGNCGCWYALECMTQVA